MLFNDAEAGRRLLLILMIFDQTTAIIPVNGIVPGAVDTSQVVGAGLSNGLSCAHNGRRGNKESLESFEWGSFMVGTLEVPVHGEFPRENIKSNQKAKNLVAGNDNTDARKDHDRSHKLGILREDGILQKEGTKGNEEVVSDEKTNGITIEGNEDLTKKQEEEGRDDGERESIDNAIGNGNGGTGQAGSLDQGASIKVEEMKDKKKRKKKKNQRAKKGADFHDFNAGASEKLEPGEDQLEYEVMKQVYADAILRTFEPFDGKDKQEIYTDVIKPIWGIIEPKEISLLDKKFRDLLKNIQEGDYVHGKLEPKEISEAALRILEKHLKFSELGDHKPLERLDQKTFKALQFLWSLDPQSILQIYDKICAQMNKYEAYRRLVILINQLSQKITVENWSLIKTVLPRISNKESLFSHLNELEKFFSLNREFPDETTAEDINPIVNYLNRNPAAFRDLGADIVPKLLTFVMSWMSPIEFPRRFGLILNNRMAIMPSVTVDIESLKNAKESQGIDLWNVIHVIEALGLRGNDEIVRYGEDKDYQRKVINLNHAIHSAFRKNFGLPWSESPERHWLVQKYGEEYQERFDKFCFHLKRVLWNMSPIPSAQEESINTKKLLNDRREVADVMLFEDHGLNFNIIRSIRSQNLDFKTSNDDINWEVIFGHFPRGLTPRQKQFLKYWFEKSETMKPLSMSAPELD
ncbi:hypothetical protein PGTUg99_025926 [Puccinia graminis f. sp. tritici]|uniref:Uncharacterized protein n=1 Tax=Puccinia graminis f. sp. tritici TaxID=56615 RepID=A0A5B0Q3E5_PUCGR|nr:hypothetical protein PGTUg99_025926 [Puccinia graminis f. sp. tritici]